MMFLKNQKKSLKLSVLKTFRQSPGDVGKLKYKKRKIRAFADLEYAKCVKLDTGRSERSECNYINHII